MAEELKPVELTVVDTNTQDWEPFSRYPSSASS